MTRIPYLDRLWSVTSGCSPVSAGCANCWSAAWHRRFRGGDFSVAIHPERLDEPLLWRKPQVVGVSFMGDLFHDAVPAAFIRRVLARAETTVIITDRPLRSQGRNRYLILTKRPYRAQTLLRGSYPPSHRVWLGVSVEDQATADERIPILLDSPVINRWVSLEPQIGPVDLSPWLRRDDPADPRPRIGWVVQGCESGPGRRPFDPAWARTVRDACRLAGICYYLKQMPAEADLDSPCSECDAPADHQRIDKHGRAIRCRGCDAHLPPLLPRVDTFPRLDGVEHRAMPWARDP